MLVLLAGKACQLGALMPRWDRGSSHVITVLRKCWKLRAAFDFAYGDVDSFGQLPFWAHFAAIAVAQFHTVLFLIILSNGLNYVLGFCPESGYNGIGRALVWWPVTDPEDLCDGG